MKTAMQVLALMTLAGAVVAQDQPATIRQLTLREAIDSAVQHNLDVQIERINPQLALYDLGSLWGSYDPRFNFRGVHSYNERPPSRFSGSFELPGSQQENDTFETGISGVTPIGTTYSLGANLTDSEGVSYRAGSATNSLGQTNFFSFPLPFNGPSQSGISLDIRQPLMKNFWIDSTRLNIRVAKTRVKTSEQVFLQQLMTTLTSVEQAYYNLIAAREYVKVQEKAVELASRLLQENRKRVEVGAMAPLDEKQAEAQAASSQADVLVAKNAVSVLEDTLRGLLTDRYSEWANVTFVPSEALQAPRRYFNRQDSWTKGLTDRPELVQAKLALERAGIQLKYARNQMLPEVDVVGSVGYNGAGSEMNDALYDLQQRNQIAWSVGGQLTVPIPNTSARQNLRASRASQEQAILYVKRVEQQIMTQIDNGIKQAQSSFQRVEATRAASEYALAALEAEQKKFESGKSTSFQVLQLQRDLTDARSSELRALADYNNALSQLSLFEGTTLQRFNINVQFK